MWCVAELDEEYIRRLEDGLAVYEKPLSEREPRGWGVALLGSSLALVGALAFLKQAVRSAD